LIYSFDTKGKPGKNKLSEVGVSMRKAVLYLRSSANDPTTENQRRELERECDEKRWKIVKVIEEEQSGTEGDRPGFKRLFEMAHQQTYDVLVTWALDRFDRQGIYETLESIRQLDDQGVDFHSYRETAKKGGDGVGKAHNFLDTDGEDE
jgi:DNA invertase Pin-like site-specific DNA recombinase